MGRPQVAGGRRHVAIGGRERRMPQQPLQRQRVAAVAQEVHREGVPEQVRVEPRDAAASSQPPHDVPDLFGSNARPEVDTNSRSLAWPRPGGR